MKITTIDRSTIEYIEEQITFEGTQYFRREDKKDGCVQGIKWNLLDNDDDVGTLVEEYKKHYGWLKDGVFSLTNGMPHLEVVYVNTKRYFI